MTLRLDKKGIKLYSVHNKGKSVAAERFIRTLKNKIYKYMTSVSRIVYIDKLDDIVNKYNNKYNRAIEIRTGDVKSSTYIDFKKKNNKEGPKLKVGDGVRISKYENIFAKGYVPNWSEQLFQIDLNGEEIAGTFYKKELQKANQKEFRVEKVIKRKGDKLYVKCKGNDNSFNSLIDKKYIA